MLYTTLTYVNIRNRSIRLDGFCYVTTFQFKYIYVSIVSFRIQIQLNVLFLLSNQCSFVYELSKFKLLLYIEKDTVCKNILENLKQNSG